MRTGIWGMALILLLAGCAGEEDAGPAERPTPVTLAEAEQRTVERVEISVGRLEANDAPEVAAETSGQVVRVHRDAGDRVAAGELLVELDSEPQQLAVNSAAAEVRRLQALLNNQRVRVTRLQNLAERQSVAQDQLDTAETEVESLGAQLDDARARLADAEFNLRRTRIVSPVDGEIQRRLVSAGDYVSPGRVLYELVAPGFLRAILPLPERLQDDLQEGQLVHLSLPARPDNRIESPISEIRPMVGTASRALELIVDLENPGGWRPGGSVTGRVILDRREGVVVPAQAVIRRPAGRVVYVVDGDRARQRTVTTGIQTNSSIEIVDGLQAGETVVVDGAGFLTDGALLDIQQPAEAP